MEDILMIGWLTLSLVWKKQMLNQLKVNNQYEVV
jgi:hypothetical protein